MLANRFAAALSVNAINENKTVATEAVPNAAPTERENCTMAAPVPSICWPATACTVTCTTPMTVPMKHARQPNAQGSCDKDNRGSQKASSSKPIVAATNPKDGNTAVRPVRVTSWPVTSEPIPMPNISGSMSNPVSAGEAPRTARR